jgi:uncharacterized protein YndB with AHSA1/START domain
MIEIQRSARIGAPAHVVWPLVSSADRTAEWFAFADRVEVLSGDGVGQRRRQHGSWHGRPSEIDQEVVAYEPERVLAWCHLAERLGGKPAPKFAASTEFRIELEPAGDGTGGTVVRLTSSQRPAGPVRGIVMKMFGTKEIAGNLERSLVKLAEITAA